MGGVAWRANLKKPYEGTAGFGTPTDYAFASITLENNYESWVRKGRATNYDFLTEYEDEGLGRKRLYVEYIHSAMEYDTEATSFEKYCVMPDEENYYKVRDGRRDAFKNLYKEIPGKLTFLTAGEVTEAREALDLNDTPNGKRRRVRDMNKERRKEKKFTSGGSGRKRYGGWSDEGHIRMEEVSAQVKEDRLKEESTNFGRALYQWQRRELELEDVDSDDSVEKHTVNRAAAWDL